MKTNYFELRGIVGNPPDARYTPNGKLVVTFSLYTRERWSDSGGEQREKTQRHQITAWGPLAQFAEKRLAKGTRVEITGRIDQQSWGEGRQYKTVLVANEIVLISSKAPDASSAAAEPESADEQAVQASDTAPAAKPEPKRRRARPAA